MSVILLIVGIILFYMGRVEVGTVRAAGRHVKAAGVILTLPAMVTVLLVRLFIPLVFGSNSDTDETAGIVAFLELGGMLVAIGLAYILIADPPGVPRLPGVLGELQDESRKSRSSSGGARPSASQNRPRTVTIPTPGFRASVSRENFPSVMTLKQAARYLHMSEEDILRLIEEGKLAASRDNFAYKIAKSQLDELRS
jgi:excisionase family DNA binding protein